MMYLTPNSSVIYVNWYVRYLCIFIIIFFIHYHIYTSYIHYDCQSLETAYIGKIEHHASMIYMFIFIYQDISITLLLADSSIDRDILQYQGVWKQIH